jgi:hypothetical protein
MALVLNNTTFLTHPSIRSLLYILEAPLADLYFRGPSLGGYGFWTGKPLDRICAELTDVPAAHWRVNEAACLDLVSRHFDGFVIFVYFILYALFILWIAAKFCGVCVVRKKLG